MQWRQLDVAVIGGGIGGLAAATSLRRAGHKVTIYERADFAGEVGASISCAANGTRWLEEWKVDIPIGRPVILQNLIMHDWESGEPVNTYDLHDYKDKWGYIYNMFHRVNMHEMLMDSATGKGEGIPGVLKVNHKAKAIDHESGTVEFENGVKATHDLIVGADGIGSQVRKTIGIVPDKSPSDSACLHCIIHTDDVKRLGLKNYSENSAIEYWGGKGIDKIVYSPCRDKEIHSFYCFFPRTLSGQGYDEGWNYEATVEELLRPYPNLDKDLLDIFKNSYDIRPWRLWNHKPYTHWRVGKICVLGDAAHPMMPDQSQGACQAIEDSAALGIIFSKRYDFAGDVAKGLELYEKVRMPRATRVQDASARARVNINERIGFSSNTSNKNYMVQDEKNKLTIEEMNEYDMHVDVAKKAGEVCASQAVTALRDSLAPTQAHL